MQRGVGRRPERLLALALCTAAAALLRPASALLIAGANSADSGLASATRLLFGSAPQEEIRAVLQRARAQSVASASAASLDELRRERQRLVQRLHLDPAVSQDMNDTDAFTETLNNLISQARVELDKKVAECRTHLQVVNAELRLAVADVREMAAMVGNKRTTILQAADETPEESEWFQLLKAGVKQGRVDCAEEKSLLQQQSVQLEADRGDIATLRQAQVYICPGGSAASLLQHPRPGAVQLHQNASRAPAKAQPTAVRLAAVRALIAQHQQQQPPPSAAPSELCSKVADALGEIEGEIIDQQARVLGEMAARRRACQQDVDFENSEMRLTARRKRDLAQQMADASSHLGGLSERAKLREEERASLQKEARRAGGQCLKDIDNLLHERLCNLRSLRDQIWLLAGRKELPEDCEVTDWKDGPCSVSCGGGSMVATRQVILSGWRGANCPALQAQRPCGTDNCPTDCAVSMWSGWSTCTAECDGGFQERTRVVTTQVRRGGDPCPDLVEMRACNSRACTRDCILGEWGAWSLCSQACAGGTQRRQRPVARQPLGEGRCPDEDAPERLARQPCNERPCPDPTGVACAGAPVDAVLLVDTSGSLGQEGFSALQGLALQLTRRYVVKNAAARVALASYADEATLISGFDRNAATLADKVNQKLTWTRGGSLVARGLAMAGEILQDDARGEAAPTVLLLTDGRVADPYLASQAAAKLRDRGARVLVVVVGPGFKEQHILEKLVSVPVEENIIQAGSVANLAQNVTEVAGRILLRTCSEPAKV